MTDLIERLQKIGLSRRESEIYIALLTKKEFTAPEIGKITSVSRNKSYEVLQSLVKKKLCSEKYKNGTKVFSGIKPDIALQNIISVYEDELEEKKILAAKFREELMSLHAANETVSDSLDYIEILTDLGQIRKRWIELQDNARIEILGFNKPPFAVSLEQNVANQEKTRERKILERGIYENSEVISEPTFEHFIKVVEMYENIGEEVKVIPLLPMKMIIIDEKITMLALNDPVSMKPTITTIIIDHPNYAKAQKIIFESYWSQSLTINEFKNNSKSLVKEFSKEIH
ncbi:MAG TPA: helix-turn-helix domain-containing protein [Ignavibacteriaceae bacterium]|nr:helix-turn-helix domain-containing protein [Ignavibacteriaceae bacterium]